MFRTFKEAVTKRGGEFSPHILKYCGISGINEWEDCTRGRLEELKETMLGSVAASSAQVYLKVLVSVLRTYRDEPEINVPCKSFDDLTRVRKADTVKTYLSREELKMFEERAPRRFKGESDHLVYECFLIGAYTGMRLSDVRQTRPENIAEGVLTYVSQKTGVSASIPVSERIVGYITDVREHYDEVNSLTRMEFNRILKRLCRDSRITKRVTVHRAGQSHTGEKWRFVSSHTARISFCTNLARLGVPLYDISRLAGHRSVSMTERYIVADAVNLSQKALQYFV